MAGSAETEEDIGKKGMKKERLLYLDVIKAIALIFVYSCHFTRSLEANGVGFVCKVLPDQIFDLYIGSFGVTLFFISSGASLMYVYGEKLEWKQYLKKRFLGIYPMFWIAFFSATLISFFREGGIRQGVPGWKIIYSILGIDGNMLWWGMNFYRLGEWFLSVIIALYLLFPLLRIGVEKMPVVTMAASMVAVGVSIAFFHTNMPVGCFVFARAAEFVFGMIMISYCPLMKLWQFAVGTAMVILAAVWNLGRYSDMIQTIIIGIGSYWGLGYVFQKIPIGKCLKNIVEYLAGISYAFFLTHHYLLEWMTARFSGIVLERAEIYLLYTGCFAVTVLVSAGLVRVNRAVLGMFTEK